MPTEKQQDLIKLQKHPGEDNFVFLHKFPVFYWVAAVAAVIWFVYLFVSTQNVRWEPAVYWLSAGVTAVAAIVFTFSFVKIVLSIVSKKSDGYIFAPDEFIKVKGDRVKVWNLKQLDSLRVDEDQTEIEVWAGEHEERFKYNDFAEAKKLAKKFDGWKLAATENFAAGLDDAKYSYSSSGTAVIFGLVAVISAVIAGGTFYAAQNANVNYDDDVVWGLAEKVGTIDDLERYKSVHPNGRHVAEANQKISKVIADIKTEYSAKPKAEADANAVETLSAMLDEIVKTADRKIFVKVKETRELDDSVIKELEAALGFDVESYEYTAPASSEEFRKEKVLADMKLALRDIVKDGAITLVATEEIPEQKPSIEINYVIKSAKTYFAYNLYFEGRNSLKYYPGLEFTFDLAMRSGADAKEFKNTYTVLPRTIKPSVFHQEDVANYTFDKTLFSTVTEDFGQQFARYLGLLQGT